MNELVSPKYLMKLVTNIENALWVEFPNSKYKNIKFYIEKWHEDDYQNDWENFHIFIKDDGNIDLTSTLHDIPSDTLLKIAIELGVETPDFIPSIPTFRNAIKSEYKTASETFEKAFKQIEEHPDIAIGLANSALESILKTILKDERINIGSPEKKTLYDLTSELLKQFSLFPKNEMPNEIKTIGSSFLAINQSIEKLRSGKTNFHGKTDDDYIIQDPMYAYFVVNSITTIGLFINSFYKNKFSKQALEREESDDNLPF